VSLSEAELERYSRQLLMDEWGGGSQERLKVSRAIVVGAGALGSPVATYLAAAGVGQIGIADGDRVELSNLHRQPIHLTPDVGAPKAEAAAAKLGLLNPEVVIEPYPVMLDEQNAEAIVMGADVVVDCTDSFEARYMVNAACCAQGVDLVEGGVVAFDGLVMSIRPGESACYRCAFPAPPPPEARRGCREAGVLGAMAGVVGSLMALEALKLLGEVGEPLLDRFLQIDGRDPTHTLVGTSRLAGCPACAGASSSA
jgi:molybdopterin-synthase adenylyltransferase